MKWNKISPVLESSMNKEQVQEDVEGGGKGFGGAPLCQTQHRSFQPKLCFSSDIQARKEREDTDKKNANKQ